MAKKKKKEKTCFVIAPIGQEGSETRKRSDQILRHVIRPAAEECGYKAIRADEISAPGLITDQIINHVLDDPMVVADLTDWNPNVFYELAIRHAFRKPFVLLFQPTPQKERIPFDVAGLRAVFLDYPDWDNLVDSRAKLVEAIQAAEAMDEKEVVTPITRAVDVGALTESEDSTAKLLAELSSSVKQLEQTVIVMGLEAGAGGFIRGPYGVDEPEIAPSALLYPVFGHQRRPRSTFEDYLVQLRELKKREGVRRESAQVEPEDLPSDDEER